MACKLDGRTMPHLMIGQDKSFFHQNIVRISTLKALLRNIYFEISLRMSNASKEGDSMKKSMFGFDLDGTASVDLECYDIRLVVGPIESF
jgi:hypothetical protein